MAVRDAARMAESKGVDPFEKPFYVALAIAKGWNLDTRHLSSGLKVLSKGGQIMITDSRKGRHTRMLLVKQNAG